MGPQFVFKTYNNNSVVVSADSPALFPVNTSEIPAASICDKTDLDSLPYVTFNISLSFSISYWFLFLYGNICIYVNLYLMYV